MNKLRNGLLLVILLATKLQILSAQVRQVRTQPDSVSTKPYWEVATDLLWLIDKNSVPASSIFFRRNFPRSNRKNAALRARIGWETEYEKRRIFNTDIPIDSFYIYKPILSLGCQVGKSKGSYSYFYGMDLLGSGFHHKQEIIDTITSVYFLSRLNITQLNIGGSLFCGLKWRLTKGISISIESHLTGIFTRYRFKAEIGQYGFKPNGFADDRITRFTTRVLPIQVINLSYNFSKSH